LITERGGGRRRREEARSTRGSIILGVGRNRILVKRGTIGVMVVMFSLMTLSLYIIIHDGYIVEVVEVVVLVVVVLVVVVIVVVVSHQS